ncbi:MAG: DUF5995 family protein [Candidatus Promineifilaceae bacterium]|nr:DUF5995 family protein [Candidatus Promineifilaceae bacterium]
MDSLLSQWQRQADRRADFLRCYRLMTGNVLLAIEQDEFHDGPWVRHLLDHFADYYFAALTAYEGDLPETPAVWLATHRAAVQPNTLILQNLLLGINAHINYDLVFTLYDVLSPEWDALSAAGRRRRYEDHRRVNAVIGRTVDAVQDDVVEPQEPLMDVIDKLLGPVDEWTASLIIRRWREEVWRHAVQMLAAPDEAQREHLRQQVETITLDRAKAILRPDGLDSFGRLIWSD